MFALKRETRINNQAFKICKKKYLGEFNGFVQVVFFILQKTKVWSPSANTSFVHLPVSHALLIDKLNTGFSHTRFKDGQAGREFCALVSDHYFLINDSSYRCQQSLDSKYQWQYHQTPVSPPLSLCWTMDNSFLSSGRHAMFLENFIFKAPSGTVCRHFFTMLVVSSIAIRVLINFDLKTLNF